MGSYIEIIQWLCVYSTSERKNICYLYVVFDYRKNKCVDCVRERLYVNGMVITVRYYAMYNSENKLLAIGTGAGGVEITQDEYNRLLAEIREKAELVDKLYSGEITLDDIPTEWQEEIQRRVNERIEAEGEAAQQDISAEEALDIILGGEDV